MMNEWLLRSRGSAWNDVQAFTNELFFNKCSEPVISIIADIISSDFSEDQLVWTLKDPRICRLIPIWNEIAQRLKREAQYLIMVRHPDEVCRSLLVRDKMPPDKCYALWLRYMLDSEKYTRGLKRLFISYDRLLQEHESIVAIIEKEMEVDFKELDNGNQKIKEFIDPLLRHHTANIMTDKQPVTSSLQEWSNSVYTLLRSSEPPDDNKAIDELDNIDQNLCQYPKDPNMVSDPVSRDGDHLLLARRISEAALASGKYIEFIYPVKNVPEAFVETIDYLVDNIAINYESDMIVAYSKHHSLDQLQITEVPDLTILKMTGSLDLSIFMRQDAKRIFFCSLDINEALLCHLIGFGTLKYFRTPMGLTMVVCFGKHGNNHYNHYCQL